MQVEAAEPRRRQDLGGQQQTVSRDNGDVGAVFAQFGLRLRVAKR